MAAYIELMNESPQFGPTIRTGATYQEQAFLLGDAHPVWAAGRYVADGSTVPGSVLVEIIEDNDLTRYDAPPPPPPPPPPKPPTPKPEELQKSDAVVLPNGTIVSHAAGGPVRRTPITTSEITRKAGTEGGEQQGRCVCPSTSLICSVDSRSSPPDPALIIRRPLGSARARLGRPDVVSAHGTPDGRGDPSRDLAVGEGRTTRSGLIPTAGCTMPCSATKAAHRGSTGSCRVTQTGIASTWSPGLPGTRPPTSPPTQTAIEGEVDTIKEMATAAAEASSLNATTLIRVEKKAEAAATKAESAAKNTARAVALIGTHVDEDLHIHEEQRVALTAIGDKIGADVHSVEGCPPVGQEASQEDGSP